MPRPKKIDTFGNVDESGKLILWSRQVFNSDLKQFSGYDVKLTLSVAGKNRTNQENRYYWAVVVPMFVRGWYEINQEWITTDEAHEKLKRECNPVEEYKPEIDRVVNVGGSTAKLTTVEFEQYQERCRQYIFEWMNIIIPLPNEVYTDELNPGDYWNE